MTLQFNSNGGGLDKGERNLPEERDHCVLPTDIDPSESSQVQAMLKSHIWHFDRIEQQRAGLYIHQSCTRCGTNSTCLLL
jgi:hypothetical protein